jgi:hypothetical protein
MADTLVKVENVSKKFCRRLKRALKHSFPHHRANKRDLEVFGYVSSLLEEGSGVHLE